MKYFWKHCYGIGDDIHWAITDEESDKENKVTDHRLVLFATEPLCMDGRPLSEQDFPKKIVYLLNKDQETCEWSRGEDYDDETWHTDCGQEFVLHEEATPLECQFNYCAFCGRRIKEQVTRGECD